jgi:hypothetical protein
MTKNRFLVFVAIVLGLTMVTTSMVARTYAKYASTIKATGTVTVAEWNVNFQEEKGAVDEQTAEFNFFDMIGEDPWSDPGVDGVRLAPGTEGSFSVVYDVSGTETALEVLITLDASELLEAIPHFEFYKAQNMGPDNKISFDSNNTVMLLNAEFAANDNKAVNVESKNAAATTDDILKTDTLKVWWKWPFDGDDDTDTTAGIAEDLDKVLTITFKAEQLDNDPEPAGGGGDD